MPTENLKIMARTPIIPDDFQNKLEHKDHEIVMDFETQDIYVKIDGQYINITGQIKDSIKEIQDGSVVIHIVTEDTLPPVKERPENHWYYIVTKAEEFGTGEGESVETYIYYGAVDDSYLEEKNYILIAQNMVTGSAQVKMQIGEGYTACFYVPITLQPRFVNHTTGEGISYDIVDRLYALNASLGTYVSYDVYMLNLDVTGEVIIDLDITGTDYFTISFDTITDVEGLKLPDPIEVKDGDSIGSIPDPTWNEARYIFTGWSTNRITYTPIDPTTYKPEKDMVLFAWFEFDPNAENLEYYAEYISTSGMEMTPMLMSMDSSTDHTVSTITSPKVLGTFCSTAKQDVAIPAKKFKGYITPKAQKLETDKERLVYLYEPEVYNIKYVLDGGEFLTEYKTTYTVEDPEYIPPTPGKNGYLFKGWQPESIPAGHTGDVTFTAAWESLPILLTGKAFNEKFAAYKETAIGITIDKEIPIEYMLSNMNVSVTDSPIYAWYGVDNYIHLYSKNGIICCNLDSAGLFEGFTKLRDISALANIVCGENTDISNLFNGCTSLYQSNGIDNWGNGKLTKFSRAFNGTLALESGRVPSWYRWMNTIVYASTEGAVLEKETKKFIPGQKVYPKKFNGYTTPGTIVTINAADETYVIDYVPERYTITYNLNGGELADAKTSYITEDITYYPPTPLKKGNIFLGWDPECIPMGSIGDKVFTAKFTQSE